MMEENRAVYSRREETYIGYNICHYLFYELSHGKRIQLPLQLNNAEKMRRQRDLSEFDQECLSYRTKKY